MKKIINIFILSLTYLIGQPSSDEEKKFKFVFDPDTITMNVGEERNVKVRLLDSNGSQASGSFMFRGQRKALTATPRSSKDSSGVSEVTIKAYSSGKLTLRAYAYVSGGDRIYEKYEVDVPSPPLDRVVFINPADPVYTGTSVNYAAEVYDKANLLRDDAEVKFSTGDKKIAEFDRLSLIHI